MTKEQWKSIKVGSRVITTYHYFLNGCSIELCGTVKRLNYNKSKVLVRLDKSNVWNNIGDENWYSRSGIEILIEI